MREPRIPRESDIEKHLVAKAKAAGGIAYKWVSPGRVGVPDRIVAMPGRVIFIELKAPGKKPEPHQLREHERLRALGHEVLVIDSKEGVNALFA